MLEAVAALRFPGPRGSARSWPLVVGTWAPDFEQVTVIPFARGQRVHTRRERERVKESGRRKGKEFFELRIPAVRGRTAHKYASERHRRSETGFAAATNRSQRLICTSAACAGKEETIKFGWD